MFYLLFFVVLSLTGLSHAEPIAAHYLQERATGFAPIGSSEWSARFPPDTADVNSMPQKWKDAYYAAKKAGKIPGFPPSKQANAGETPTYEGYDASKYPVCSSSYQCRIDGEIWDAPEGTVGISFDDGPLPPSANLNTFLHDQRIPSAHFYIGKNALQNPQNLKYAVETLQADLAVHTWTHPYMTTLSDLQIVAELGWSMQLIYDSTGGKVPQHWRPPYGDCDLRVFAIAKEVFGLKTVLWNQDTNDWRLTVGGQTQDGISALYDEWLSGSKANGLIALQHELSDQSVQSFKNNYYKFAQHGWTVQSTARLYGSSAYQNAHQNLFSH